ncbi:family 4 glycosyl hydrolase, alpha-galactosidase/6-phospho-beta-glucosidase [Halobacteroides halobius DSM 5150]|uniref:Family 4 glycosyl hydrolase, alpha-galactosidase/6-phospho-beta-glucosidase n=1 Tax=Halobacteroides halobius (strain ATCC 35273 / DSM 5150 / MD-1) TaxID=748449 RepID=L0K949_HALHC|nr:family 4 glycosyl hydrolase alpha-galactosidase/6-phospho-beta-glucosidase [Halobacteroides halobius]AGB41080.1 family 4 glycosyl hydrolase, alpha-galactosidase/6-phospho-beta-glucosidase [Halobacteroides halobius DSM 5150]
MGIKLTVIGGSGLYTPLLFDAIINNEAGIDFDEVCLNGRTKSKLERIGQLSQNLIAKSDCDFDVTYTTDRQEALTGADIVLCQIRVGGMKARADDEEFPLTYDIIGEETVGPGGFANALRTVPVMLNLAKEVEKYAPDALFMNLTNPCSIVQQALEEKTNLNIIGICDLPVGMIQKMANLLEVDPAKIDVEYQGLNHLGWYTGVYVDGENKIEELINKVEKLELGIDSNLIKKLNAIPLPYLKFYYHHKKEVNKAKNKEQLRANELLATQDEINNSLEKDLTKIPELIYQRGAIWYSDVIVPLISALNQPQEKKFIVNLPNDGLISGVDDEVIVEVPAVINSSGIKPLQVPNVSLEIKTIIQQSANYRNLATQAALSQESNDILQALAANPQVVDYDIACEILENNL